MIRIYQSSNPKCFEWSIVVIIIMIFKIILGSQIHVIKIQQSTTLTIFMRQLPNLFKSLPKRYNIAYLDEDGDQISLEDQNDFRVLLQTRLRSVKVMIKPEDQEFMKMMENMEICSQKMEMDQEISSIRSVKEKQDGERMVDYSMFSKIEESMIEEKIKKMLPNIISHIKSQMKEEMLKNSFIKEKNAVQQPKQSQIPQNVIAPVVHHHYICDNCGQDGIIGIRYKCSVCENFDFCQKCQAIIEHEHPFLKIRKPSQAPRKIMVVLNNQKNISNQIPFMPFINNVVNQGVTFVKGIFSDESVQRQEPKKEASKYEKQVQQKVSAPLHKAQKIYDNQMKVDKVDQGILIQNAKYVAESIHINFDKCFRSAKQNPHLNKYELLDHCINHPSYILK